MRATAWRRLPWGGRLLDSVALGNEGLGVPRRARVWPLLSRGELDRTGIDRLVGDLLEQMGDQVESGGALVVSRDDEPRGVRGVGVGEHLVLCLGVVDPASSRLDVDRAQLPALNRVLQTGLEAALLLLVADREPVLQQHDSRTLDDALELRTGAHELLVLLVGAEAHHPLDAGAVVP